LEDKYKINEDNMGYYMLFHCAPYLPAALILPYALKRVPAKLQFVFAFYISFIGQGLMGTS
jgi:hypothetical protein